MPASNVLHIVSVEVVSQGQLKLTWDDGYEGVVDLRKVIARGGVFNHIRNPENFSKVRREGDGYCVYWGEEGNEQVDFGCDRLREMAEEQAG